ncbi:DSD1 family PLP-dependent enzyme [Allosphingosinicella deserti]|uniref:Threonine aldolase n=1 Tax=Allosphingosinicella deserti TaxID=2116704 RepID=A0A2P7QJ53_9SPHN|nr:DSD1 family PLP-dependent enzyme [Sphingomonas deserti]PSJ38008.1 threonine aldolase [Sphingomonas deserti]
MSTTPPFPRAHLATPALIVDLPAFERNVAAMAAWARGKRIALRPHAKTHKSGEIARRQIAAGAVGICCAKLGEAEALAAEGIEDILITSPVVPRQPVERLARLNERVERLAVVVDHPDNVDRLAAAVGDGRIDVLVDLDTGSHRTGVTSPEAAVSLAERIAANDALGYLGVQFYCGSLQHVPRFDDRQSALAERAAYLRTILQALSDAGLPARTVTGGGTGSFAIDAELGLLNELQAGSYIFMDRQYQECEPAALRFEQALSIDTRVISANTPGRVTIDAGLKAMATDGGAARVLAGADPGSAFLFMGDEHGMLVTPEGGADPRLDDLVTLLPPHCDPTVNLYDQYAICRDDLVIDTWPVSARGRSA